jgi:hypothetical protein
LTTEPATSPPTIAPDQIAADLGGEAIPEGYVRFKGYLDGGTGGVYRIVADDQFLRWLEVRTEDIAGRLDGSANPIDHRDLIWVRRGARMNKCEVGYAPDIADEGWCVDTERHVDVDHDRKRRPPPPY